MKIALLIVSAVIVLAVALGAAALRLPVFGARQSEADRQRFAASARFDADSGRFVNRRADALAEMRADSLSPELLREWFRTRPDGRPAEPLPETRPDLDAFLDPAGGARAIWFGHSTLLLNVDGLIVLVDPVFSASAAPVDFTVRRFQPPVIGLGALPPVDVVLISHDHYDHLDTESIRLLAGTDAAFVAPLGVGAHLERWGVAPGRIVERDWWESHEIDGVTFTAAPAQHFSGRGPFDADRTLWASWAITGASARLYYSGDSGYDLHFSEIGERLGPFDVAFLENGQYDLGWRAVHMLPEETVDAFEALDARRLFPVHWGMFELAFHTWYDPAVALAAIADARGIDLLTPIIGEVFELGGGAGRATDRDAEAGTDRWWVPLLPDATARR